MPWTQGQRIARSGETREEDMSEESTVVDGGDEALPVAVETKAPRNDAEAEQIESAKPTEAQPEAPKPEDKNDGEEKRKNRTKAYIDRINRENAELRARVAEREHAASRTAPEPAQGEPTIDQFNWDIQAFQRAHTQWALQDAHAKWESEKSQAETSRRQAETAATYSQKAAEFAYDHPDFVEVASSIPYPLSADLEAAIMAHEMGPEIAYHLGNNDDDAFQLASIQPHLAAAAVDRLAKRLLAAHEAPGIAAPAAPIPTPSRIAPPVSKAPAPLPSVGGRSPVATPPEKMTDDQWYAQDREKRRKR
jgi:hypothetical protein